MPRQTDVDVVDPLSRVRERVRVRVRELRQAAPDAENALWQALRNRQLDGYKFRRQHAIGKYFADFACLEAQLVVELDGGQHFDPQAMAADERRTQVLNRLGFHVLRFTNLEVLTEREAVLCRILDWLHTRHPHPRPLPQAGEGANASQLPLPLGEGRGEGSLRSTSPIFLKDVTS